MALPKDAGLYIFEIVAYALLMPVVVYLTFRHGSPGILGFLSLNVACAIRSVADILALATSTNAGHPSIATAVVSSIGLSPLIIALAGMLHEAHVYLLCTSSKNIKSTKQMKKWLWIAQIQIHSAVIAGMVLLIMGTVNLYTTNNLTTADLNNDNRLRSAGSVIVLVVWVILLQYAGFLTYWARRTTPSDSIIQLSTWPLYAAVPIGVRVAYSVAYTFDHKDSQLSPTTGALWVKVVFMTLCPLLAVILMTIGGWKSKDIKTERFHRAGSDDTEYQSVPTK